MLPARGEFRSINAFSSGIVRFDDQMLEEGVFIKKDEVVFKISGQGTSENNIETRFAVVSSEYERSKADYERKKILHLENILSAREFEESMAKFRTDSSLYFNLLKEFGNEGLEIKSMISGTVYELNVSDGDYVKEGQILAKVSAGNKMRIHVDVPQKHYNLLKEVNSLQFKPSFINKIFTMEELNGRLISRGNFADKQSGFVPIIFEVENRDFLAGAFVECWLLTKPEVDQLVIPKSAMIEEQGIYYVFVQIGGELFEKRQVRFDIADGVNAKITGGLEPGERIVNKGAMTLKVASLSGALPDHSHDH